MNCYVIAFFKVKGIHNREEFFQLGDVYKSLSDAVNHVYEYSNSGYQITDLGELNGVREIWIEDSWNNDRQVAYIVERELA